MKTLTLITAILLSLSINARERQPHGVLICWDNQNPAAYIDGYQGNLNDVKLDQYGRRSFIMDFREDSDYWGFGAHETDQTITQYGWSYSECEDMNYFNFDKKQLRSLLKGSRRSMKVGYEAHTPDEVIKVDLRCVKMTEENDGRPVLRF